MFGLMRPPVLTDRFQVVSDVFELNASDVRTAARTGVLHTRRGTINTPVFMPVGTQATVKSVTPDELQSVGSQVILGNTYHLMLRPGVETLRAFSGLHSFMGWSGPILTDSGGFQIFSLAENRRVDESGVVFQSHIDGRRIELSPEEAIDLQLGFGSDIIMPLDHLCGFDAPYAEQRSAQERTHRWLNRCIDHFALRTSSEVDDLPLLFGIAQGGFDKARRAESAAVIAESDVSGCAIGGLSVGETKPVMHEMLEASIAELPDDKPRYLMGVGSPEDLWEAVSRGVDMFDCVHPTRVARRGALYTPGGRVNITAARYRNDPGPIDAQCDCYTCKTFSAAYVHHLFRTSELLAYRLGTIHNLRFMHRQMEEIRRAINIGTFTSARDTFLSRYQAVDPDVRSEQQDLWRRKRSSNKGEMP